MWQIGNPCSANMFHNSALEFGEIQYFFFFFFCNGTCERVLIELCGKPELKHTFLVQLSLLRN